MSPSLVIPLAVIILSMCAIYVLRSAYERKRQLRFIDNYTFHDAITQKFREKRPELGDGETALVYAGLRDYFHICHHAGRRMVSMPSQVVDDAWHEFILFTRTYQRFCNKAFSRFLHHTPAEAMPGPTSAQTGIKRAWRLACAKDGVNPKHPVALPLLFRIDKELGIDDGFYYELDCTKEQFSGRGRRDYCATHIGCASGCGGDSGADTGSSCGGDSSCGGGCGGD